MTVEKLLEKINKVADNNRQIADLKKKQEHELVEAYKEQIKYMSSRISDMLLLVNTLYNNRLYSTEKLGIGKTNEGIHFYGGDTYKVRFNAPYKIVAYTKTTDISERSVYVFEDGTVKYMDLNYNNDYEIEDREVPSQLLLKFIVAFEQVEKQLQNYIESL